MFNNNSMDYFYLCYAVCFFYKTCRKTHPSPAWMGCKAQRF